MALPAAAIFEINNSADAVNVGGGGFNPANANMLADFACTNGTSAAPVITSATYTFVAGDVGKLFYQQRAAGSWTPGWYTIASVSAGAATLNASVGAAIQVTNNRFNPNTVQGIGTTATLTGGVGTFDLSQAISGVSIVTDYASVGASTNLTSATAAFTQMYVGNFFHLNNAGTGAFGVVGWYELVSYTNATTMVTDRTTNSGTAMVAGQGRVGGALSLGSADDAVFELAVSSATVSARFFVAVGGTYTLAGAVSIAAGGDPLFPIIIEGYFTTRGDRPVDATRPTLACGANVFTLGTSWDVRNIIFTGTASPVVAMGTNQKFRYNKVTNSSTTAGRSAVVDNVDDFIAFNELISYRGRGISNVQSADSYGNYIHDCDIGINLAAGASHVNYIGNVIACCVTAAISCPTTAQTGACLILGNTLYGAENKLGVGLNLKTGCTDIRALNNIFYGFTTAISHADASEGVVVSDFNDFYNNTTDLTNVNRGANDQAVNPNLGDLGQVTGATATTTSGNHLVQAGADFITQVSAGRDFLQIISGTGVTAGIYGIASVDSSTQLTTDIAIAANATADKVFQITCGRMFVPQIEQVRKLLPGGLTFSYDVPGAAQLPGATIAGSTTQYLLGI